MKKVTDENYAYSCERYRAYSVMAMTFTPVENCEVREIVFYDDPVIGTHLRKHSPLRDRLASIWLWMVETGIFDKYNQHWAIKRPPCIAQYVFIKVGFDYLGPLLVFLLFVHALSSIILIGEICSRRTRPASWHVANTTTPEFNVIYT